MQGRPQPLHTGWWSGRPQRRRWVYALVTGIILGSVLGVLTLVPVPRTANAQYVVLLALPTNATTPSCQGAVFNQVGTYHFIWLFSSGNPTTMTVQNSNGGPILYNQTTIGEGEGSVKVDGAATFYVFCLKSFVDGTAATPGPQSVAEVVGDLTYEYTAPIL